MCEAKKKKGINRTRKQKWPLDELNVHKFSHSTTDFVNCRFEKFPKVFSLKTKSISSPFGKMGSGSRDAEEDKGRRMQREKFL